MKAYKIGPFIFKINLSMDIVEQFFSLGYKKMEVNRDLMRLLRVPPTAKAKEIVEQEIKVSYVDISLDKLKRWCAEMGKIDRYQQMTGAEIKIAYEGQIKLIYNLGNLYIVAERKASDPNAAPFIYEEEVSRHETFKKFGLEE